MLISRKNPLGGRPLAKGSFPLHQDKQGNFGLLIGYDRDGDKMLISMSDVQDFANTFAENMSPFQKLLKKNEEKIPWKHRIAMWLIGKKTYYRLVEQEEEKEW